MIRSLVLASIAAIALSVPAMAADEPAAGKAAPVAGGVAPALAPTLAPDLARGDAEVAEWIRELLASDLYRYVPREEDREGVAAFYRARGFAPVWFQGGAVADRARDVVAVLRDAAAEGLDVSQYPAPYFNDASGYRRAADELMLTTSVLAYARHARFGRVGVTPFAATADFEVVETTPADVMNMLAGAPDVRAALQSLSPQTAEFAALKQALAEERRGAEAPRASANTNTRPRAGLADTILANMERARWLPRDLGAVHVVADIGDGTLKVVDGGKTIWSTALAVGKGSRSAAPLFGGAISGFTVSPSRTRRVRLEVPNKFGVVVADNPDAPVAGRPERAPSRGTMLVTGADQLVEVLSPLARAETGMTAEEIRAFSEGAERTVAFAKPIPFYVVDRTAGTDAAGALQTRADVYGYDKDIVARLRGERPVAEVAVERPAPKPARQAEPYPQFNLFGWR